MKHIYVLNPAAGRGDRSAELTEQIHSAYPKGESVQIYRTTGRGDATRFVRAYCAEHKDESLRFYACGGDGTLGEVVNGAIGFPNAAVGLLPVGTGNDFVRSFTSPDRFLNLAAQRMGKEIVLDVIRCNDLYCVNLLNIGFDCEVVVKTGEIKRKPYVPKGMAYGMGVALELIRKPGVKAMIEIDGGAPCERELLLCAIGNGAYYGGGFMPLPFASLQDGLLDLCIVKNVSRTKFVSLVGTYKKGKHVVSANKDILEYRRCRSLRITFPSLQNVCLDGEVRPMNGCDIEVLPAALRFVVPVGSEPIRLPDYVADEMCEEVTV